MRIWIAMVGVLFGALVLAQEPPVVTPTLNVGDPAPALKPGKWIKGDAVPKFEKGKLYVIEFWATWCGPCRASIPHLSELQKQYPDVIFIGQDVWERNEAAVEPFVNQMGDKMKYRVAMDNPSGETGFMAINWMVAAGQDGIPTAFVIDKESRIAWIGHPMRLDRVLKAVIDGSFDAKAEAAKTQAFMTLTKSMEKAARAKDAAAAIKLIDDGLKAHPEWTSDLGMYKFQLMIQSGDSAGAMAYADQIFDAVKDDAEALNGMAWTIVDPESQLVPKPDLVLAEKLAARACELSKNQNPAILDTMARVYFAKGEVDKAIKAQQQAVDLSDGAMKVELQKTLHTYKAAALSV